MKTHHLFFLATMLLFNISSFGQNQNTLIIVDPAQPWWNGNASPGSISDVEMQVRTTGSYAEIGLIFVVNVTPAYSDLESRNLEAVIDFILPKDAIVHDSWLWIGNDIVQADIRERSIANAIYENIVRRNNDPSILFKNSNDTYQLRIFPISGTQGFGPRKVKITYLVPLNFSTEKISVPLPTHLMEASATLPPIRLKVDQSILGERPVMMYKGNHFQLPFLPNDGYYDLSLTPLQMQASPHHRNNQHATAYLQWSRLPLPNGANSLRLYQETAPNEGFIQTFIDASDLCGNNHPQKFMFIYDIDRYNASRAIEIGMKAVLNDLIQVLQNVLTDGDQYNVIYYNRTQSRYNILSNQWQTFRTASPHLLTNGMMSGPLISNMDAFPSAELIRMLNLVINMPDTMHIICLNQSNNNVQSAPILAQLNLNTLSQKPHQYHSIDITNIFQRSFNQITASTGNAKVYATIAQQTRGRMFVIPGLNNSYYNGFKMLHNLSESPFFNVLNSTIHACNFETRLATIQNTDTSMIAYHMFECSQGMPYLRFIEKYYGTPGYQTRLLYQPNGGVFSIYPLLTHTVFTSAVDTLHRKIWNYEYISTLGYNSKEAMDSSLANRVLFYSTAFLALEPSDTVSICENCVIDFNTFTNPEIVGLSNYSSLANLQMFPNPFEDALTIQFSLKEQKALNRQVKIRIFDLMGRVIWEDQWEITSSEKQRWTWEGQTIEGSSAPNGVYLVQISMYGEKLAEQKVMKVNR